MGQHLLLFFPVPFLYHHLKSYLHTPAHIYPPQHPFLEGWRKEPALPNAAAFCWELTLKMSKLFSAETGSFYFTALLTHGHVLLFENFWYLGNHNDQNLYFNVKHILL